MRLVLASGSAARAQMLSDAGVEFVRDPADIDEAALTQAAAPASAVARLLAEEKARHVSRRHPGALVLGGDSVLDFEGKLIAKSPDVATARALLARLAGRTHAIVSGAALARDGAIVWTHVGEGRLTMRAFGPEFLDAYLEATSPAILASVGCYHLEGRGSQLFDRIEGDYFSILGLPLLRVLAALREQGILKP